MKKSVFSFLGMALLGLAVVPVINLTILLQTKTEMPKWERSELYKLDFALPIISQSLYRKGISIAPKETIIGKDGWLYLGEKYQIDGEVKRRGINADEMAMIKKIGTNMTAWEQWLKQQGVAEVKIMFSPNKDTIYPEYLPDWAQSSNASVSETLLANVKPELFFDTRPALKTGRQQYPQHLLYFKTDTHWNSLGAWCAFRAFTQEIKRDLPELKVLSDEQISITPTNKIQAGDLAHFLRLQKELPDVAVYAQIKTPILQTEQYDFESGKLNASGIGNPEVAAPVKPLLVISPNALNQKKVLWLRDSYGGAVSPFMAASFSNVLQLHYVHANPALMAQMIARFKPDYVFVTVLEREAHRQWFANLAPPER